jgi:plastocyanin
MAGEEHHARSEIRARGHGICDERRLEIVRLRRRYLPLAVLLGAAAAALPAIASSETSPSVEAVNTKVGSGLYEEERHSWQPAQVAVTSGGVVTFSNPTAVQHGVNWVGGPATPSCSGGVPVGTTPAASGTKWSGTCTFSQAGTYTFYCTVHGAEMTGTITVNPNGTTTVTPPPTTTTTAPTEPPAEAPIAISSLRSPQHGGSVKGSVMVSRASAGGGLEVDVFATSASLARAKRPVRVRVGRFVRHSVPTGKTAFVVPLSARARRALRRHHRLALTVRIVLTPVHGEATVLHRSVTERP